MAIRNTRDAYGIVARGLHWSMALFIVGMFGLGLWMRSLGLYHPWYKAAPEIHKGIGIILLAVLVVRFGWRLINISPDETATHPLERRIARVVHWGFYPLLLALMVSGYLISTAGGRPIDVFGLFSVPAIIERKGLEDQAGFVHEYLAYATIALASLHALAALKHHFIDKDATLRRMVRSVSDNSSTQPKEET